MVFSTVLLHFINLAEAPRFTSALSELRYSSKGGASAGSYIALIRYSISPQNCLSNSSVSASLRGALMVFQATFSFLSEARSACSPFVGQYRWQWGTPVP